MSPALDGRGLCPRVDAPRIGIGVGDSPWHGCCFWHSNEIGLSDRGLPGVTLK